MRKKGVSRKAAAAAQPSQKLPIAIFGKSVASTEAFDFVNAMLDFHIFFTKAHGYDAVRGITLRGAEVVATLTPTFKNTEGPQRCRMNLRKFARRIAANDVEFFETIVKFLRWRAQGGEVVDEPAYFALMALGLLTVRSIGEHKITSKDLLEKLEEWYPLPDGKVRDEGNVRTLVRELGIKLPIAAKDIEKFFEGR